MLLSRTVTNNYLSSASSIKRHIRNNRAFTLISIDNTYRINEKMTESNCSFSTFKTWPKSKVESRGDYRQEAYLEDVIGGTLYSKQKMLPPLPIPSLEETAGKFLATALPLAETEEEARSLIEAVEIFPSEATKLQHRLQNRKEDEMKDSSWLQHWWNTIGYLQVRDPVVVNVSYFLQLADDETLPSEGGNKSLGVMRGAAILHAIADYRKLVCSGSLPYESIGRKEKDQIPLCSTAFKYMFHGKFH